MADSKITALTALTAADPVNDMFPVVDVSDTSMAASGTTKRISANNILSSSPTASGALTVTGLVTAGSATITGDLTVDTSTLKVDATNDRVGIGTASPLSVFTVQSHASSRLSVRTTDAVFGSIAGGTAFDSLNGSDASLVPFGCRGSTISFGSSGGGIGLQLDASNNVNVPLGNVVMGTSGKGIDFSATASGTGTMTSELLNDYEEGTWTPTDLSGAGLVFSIASCRYTKVGRLVTVQGSVTYPATVSGANALWGGFPFVAADNIFLTIAYTDTPIATFTYFSGISNAVYLLTPGVNTINSSLSLRTITFFGTYMV